MRKRAEATRTISWWTVVNWSVVAVWLGWHTICELRRPRLSPEDILHDEAWRSGCRRTNFWTRLGYANNCLRVVFLRDRIMIRPHYPFSIIARFYGLDLDISVRR